MPDGSEFLPEYAKAPSMFRPASDAPNNILIDAPANNTIYPPDIIPPQFKWRDNNAAATVWRIEIVFENGKPHPRLVQRRKTADRRARHRPHRLCPSHPHARKSSRCTPGAPTPKLWDEIKKRSAGATATVVISGFASDRTTRQPVSHGPAVFTTSKDPVAAPIFYRDVPLIPPQPETEQRGVIKPLPDSVLPKIRWQLRYINEPRSR